MHSVQSALQLILVSCLLALLAPCAEGKSQGTKDNLYSLIDIRNAPFTVQLRDEAGKFLCAGALISSDSVVTSADCCKDIDYTKDVVVAGATTLTDEGVQCQIAKATIHPKYDPTTKSSNVAVLKLKEPLKTGKKGQDNIVSIPLWEEEVTEKLAVQVVGWRHMSKEEDTLYTTRINVVSQEKCNEEFSATPDYGIFCAAGNDYDDQYIVSDVGGPAVVGGKLGGIASTCKECKEINYSTSFTDLHYFLDFIKEASA